MQGKVANGKFDSRLLRLGEGPTLYQDVFRVRLNCIILWSKSAATAKLRDVSIFQMDRGTCL